MKENIKEIYRCLDEIEQAADRLLLRDREALLFRTEKIRDRLKKNPSCVNEQMGVIDIVRLGMQRKALIESTQLKISYPENLPISQVVDHIKETLQNSQVIIVCGATGSGKSTQLPKLLWECGFGKKGRIGCTQPRRLAATSMARRVAQETETVMGKEVGYQVRFDDQTTDQTIIKFMTDGILLSETRHDKKLWQYEAIIIDEAHERSLNIDFLLGYLKNLLLQRSDLKIIISSATLDAEGFSQFFQNAPVIEVEGTLYPITDFYLPPEEEEEISTSVLSGITFLDDLGEQLDTLVFLPGEREIVEATELLEGRKFPNTEILPLYGRLSMGDQQRVFQMGTKRRIILSTNVAETSLTIPGIRCVIDTGLVRLSRYCARTKVQSLQIEQISQASARQRRGRCGRVGPGICIHLYSESLLAESAPYTDPEIGRSSLAGIILQMKMLGLPEISEFPLMNPPLPVLIREGYRTLIEIGALNAERHLIKNGRNIAKFPVDPHLARMIIQAEREKCLSEILALVAFLSIQDPRERPLEKQSQADAAHRQWLHPESDFLTILNLWYFLQKEQRNGCSQSRFRRLCKSLFLNWRRIKEWINLESELHETAEEMVKHSIPNEIKEIDQVQYDSFHKAILAGLPMNLAKKTETSEYLGMNGRKSFLFPGSVLFAIKPEWILTFEWVETSKLFARISARANPEWLLDVAPTLCKSHYDHIYWNEHAGFVYAKENVVAGGLLIRHGKPVHYGPIDPVASRQIFIRDGLVPGALPLTHPWLQEYRNLLQKIYDFEIKIRRPESLFDSEALFQFFEQRIPPTIWTAQAFQSWLKINFSNLKITFEEAIIPQLEPLCLAHYPDELIVANQKFILKYEYNPGELTDGISLFIPENQLEQIPDYLPDWLVPGFLPEKVRLLLKSLRKSLRVQLGSLDDATSFFLAAVQNKRIHPSQPLVSALAFFVSKEIDEIVTEDDFNVDKLPDYLIMKWIEVDEKGKIKRISKGIPERKKRSSKLYLHEIDPNKFTTPGRSLPGEWPGDSIPTQLALDPAGDLLAFPGLAVQSDHSVSLSFFHSQEESISSHNIGLVHLFRTRFPEIIKQGVKSKQLPNPVEKYLRINDPQADYYEDIIQFAVWDALTDGGKIEIRDPNVFAESANRAKITFYSCYMNVKNQLDQCMERIHVISGFLRQTNSRAPGINDIEKQLEFLFRKGFLQSYSLWQRTPFYLKGLAIRAERLKNDHAKDTQKMQQLIEFQNFFEKGWKSHSILHKGSGFWRFAFLLQEFRLSVFSPEIRPSEKVSTKILSNYTTSMKQK